ncbi:DUF3367 domain-containing protein [Gordonia soli]|uniref:F5/8 type C domain-containing protein n=1 Tax=Gordonia soli NBRC 108243 TaxID=1223545 RepID=M0QFZ4_9ACTN|nr:DUF3367 domain-containing protein [Gordonia soli]GAC67231.1 hypothetical protein GS4_06_00770 [Gordonia soli NBRC 108243]
MTQDDHSALSRRGVVLVAVVALVVALLQSPGRIAADTKLDLTADPLGFLARALHLWSPDAPMGQVQNQAYGYFFPHGAFFALGDLIALPPWVVQRLWWAILLAVGVVGIVRLAEALRIGSPASRLIAAVIFVVSPRVLTTLGSISSETLPMILAPWVLVPVVRACDPARTERLWRLAFRSAAAVALMGAVNAVATLAALAVAAVWWVAAFPGLRRPATRSWVRFGGWWSLGLALVCAWWVVPLLILSRVSPPFLDFIESSRVTTEWTSLTEVLRGTSSWTPFVSPERVAGAVLVTQPAAVLATGVLAAAGLAGLAMRHIAFRGRLVAILLIGLTLMCTGYAGELGSPIAEPIKVFLDGAGAPLRNIHKFEPFIRIPLVLGIAHLLARVPLPSTVPIRETASAFAHPQRSRPVAATIAVLVAAIGAGSLMWTGQLAPSGTYRAIPDHWRQTADWLASHSNPPGATAPVRSLVVPGAPFADQLWGLTRDEPLQALADDPWAVRDAIPLTPPGAIRALDSVQRDIAAGRGSPGLAPTLAQQGIGFVVLRADLDPQNSRSTRPLVAQQALDRSPGLIRVAEFGPRTGPPTVRGVVRDSGLRPTMPAVQIYAVRSDNGFPGTGPTLVDADGLPRVAGGPESLAAIQADQARTGGPPIGPMVLESDARRAGLARGELTVTDTPTDRETDFGRVDDHSSAIRGPGDARTTQNATADYPVDGQPLVRGQWLLDNQPDQVRVSSSGSAADATQLGQTAPAASTAAAFDGDPETAWVSRGLDSAVGQWLRLDFTRPRSSLAVTVTTAAALGSDVSGVLVTTEAGSTVAQGLRPGEPTTVTAPSGPTRWVQVRAISTADGTAGNQFAVGELGVSDLNSGLPLTIRHRVALPELRADDRVGRWLLTQELGGRSPCVDDRVAVRCAGGLGAAPETPGILTRSLSVPAATSVAPTVTLRPTPGDGLSELLSTTGHVTADGDTSIGDPRGSPSAAVDGDRGTTWTAPETESRSRDRDEGKGDDEKGADENGDEKDSAKDGDGPLLVVRLPATQRVEQLRLVTRPDFPAAPTRVALDLGTGRQVREVGRDGVVRLDPAETRQIRIRVLRTTDVIDVNSLGFARPAPAGISEVEITPRPPAPADPDREIRIGCDRGIGLTVSGQVVPLSVTTTARALRDGVPVVARPCSPQPVSLGAGEQELSVNPGTAFTVDAVDLRATGDPSAAGNPSAAGDARANGGVDRAGSDSHTAPSTAPMRPADVIDWSSTHRAIRLSDSERAQVLVVPESTNPGWRATVGDRELAPVVVNGWQQGWVVPAGTSGELNLTYRLDSLYRWSLGLGLAVMALVLALAFWPRRWTPRALVPAGDASPSTDPPEPVQATSHQPTPTVGIGGSVVAATGVAVASWLLAGWWGLVVSALGAVVAVALRPRGRVVVVFVAMLLASIALASGPWHASGGYTGFQWWVQLPAVVAVAVTAWSVAIPDSWRTAVARAVSRRRSHRRAGSSTKA